MVNQTLKRIVADYNAQQKDASRWLPEDLSAHVLRHTYSTRLFELGIDPKVMQILLGHTKVSTTLDIYTDVLDDHKNKVFVELEGKLNVV